MKTVLNKWLVVAGLLVSASSFACGDYCDSGWAGVQETGGSSFYQSAYDVYQTAVDVDITTTTYMPVYDNSAASAYGSSCGSLLSTCGGGYGTPTLDPSISGLSSGMPGDYSLLPRDPMNPYNPLNPNNPFDPNNPINNPFVDPIAAGIAPMGPNMGLIARDPAVLPPTMMPQPLPYPIGMNPFTPQIPYTQIPRSPYYPPVTPPVYPPYFPPVNPPYFPPVNPPTNPIAITPVGVGTSTLPNTTTVNRDPNTPYMPPAPPPFGGCNGTTVACPTGPVVRPTGGTTGTPQVSTLIPGNTVPTVTVPNSPVVNLNPTTTHTGSAPQRNNVPRGALPLRSY